jgi:hypothetical protein
MAGSGEGAGSHRAGPSAGAGHSSGIQVGNFNSQIVFVGVAAGTLGPFINAFCTELGRRFGGSVADWVSRVHADARERTPGRVDLSVDVGEDVVSTTIDLDAGQEEATAARAAELVSRQVQERGLKWDEAAGTWAPPD